MFHLRRALATGTYGGHLWRALQWALATGTCNEYFVMSNCDGHFPRALATGTCNGDLRRALATGNCNGHVRWTIATGNCVLTCDLTCVLTSVLTSVLTCVDDYKERGLNSRNSVSYTAWSSKQETRNEGLRLKIWSHKTKKTWKEDHLGQDRNKTKKSRWKQERLLKSGWKERTQ